MDLRSEIHLLQERREALVQELKSRSTATLQTAEEAAQERAESNALRSALTYKQHEFCGVYFGFNSCC